MYRATTNRRWLFWTVFFPQPKNQSGTDERIQ
jgi:hypothetical protein